MSIEPVALGAVSELNSSSTAVASLGTAELAAPTDPFEILLAAASSPSTANAATAFNGSLVPSASDAVGSQLVSLASAEQSPPGTTDSSGQAIVSTASRYLGVPYVWGGASPSGFDCSGLVQYVFGQLGVSLPRTAAEQEQIGAPVASLADAQPGDLLFFEPGANGAPPGEAGHVAIYVGNDEMIAAPETGEDVQVQQVPDTPLAIRRVAVPASASDSIVASDGGASIEMGNVAVPTSYASEVEQAATQSGTPAPLLAAILEIESGFNPSAVSSAGAQGIAQIMPATAEANGIDPDDPSSAITGAANLLAGYHSAFGSWSDAVAAYAAGGGAVEAAGGIPNDGTTPAYVSTALSLAGMAPGS